MTDSALLRLTGLAALLGGLFRLTSPFFGMLVPDTALHLLWAGTDLLLLFGMLGLWASTRRRAGAAGLIGLTIALAGLLLVRSSAEGIFGGASYDVAAGVWGVGQAVTAIALLIGRAGYRTASALWLASLLLGLAGERIDLWLDGFGWAGLVFAAGHVAAGIGLLRHPAAASGDTA